MTKLSFVVDHEIRCWMFGSSSMLGRVNSKYCRQKETGQQTYLYNLWMNAVCTTFG